MDDQPPAIGEQTAPETDAQRLAFEQETANRRAFHCDEAAHRAAMLAAFYGKLVEGGVPEDEAFSFTRIWLKQGMLL